jgi:hypothetical protein
VDAVNDRAEIREFLAMEIRAEGDVGPTLTAYSAEPASPPDDAPKLLASWAATGASESETESANSDYRGH